MQETDILKCHRREASLKNDEEMKELHDARIDLYLEWVGFAGVAHMEFIRMDWALITALVERWRPETHTFHMTYGEVSLTLQDVALQFGLPIDGRPVTGQTGYDLGNMCATLLGARLEGPDIKSQRVWMSWLASLIRQRLPEDADEQSVQCRTRIYILLLIGGVLFPDTSGSHVHLMFLLLLEDFRVIHTYSWGLACLAWLLDIYAELRSWEYLR